jgi:hypothetical protein
MKDPELGSFWQLIFPQWDMITSGSVKAVTPFLVLVVWLVALFVCGFAWRQAHLAIARITEARRPVAGLTGADLRARRNDVRREADACSDVVRDAWREFDETLVTDDAGLYNTVDAAEFFNEHRFAPRLVGNRFLQASPTALTTLGLLGTFIGLTVGLRGLDLGSTAEELRVGIQTLVAGAALGFTASLWGVFASLVTNVFERWQERRVVVRVNALASDIDKLFQMRSPEQSLSEIAAHSSESKEALQVLHEKIGSALQETVKNIGDDTSRAVSVAIQESLAPIMADLAKRAADQSADVFKEISGQLTQSFNEIGRSLAEELKASSESMRTTLDYMGEKLAQQADQHLAQMDEMHRATAQHLTSVVAATERQIALLDESLPKVVTGLEQAASLVVASTSGVEAVSNLGGMLAQAIGTMDEMATKTSQAASALASQQASVSDLTDKAVTAADLLRATSASLNGGFEGMRAAQASFLHDLEQQLHKHSQSMAGWLASYGDQVSKQTAHRMDEWNMHTEKFTSHMVTAANALSDVIDELGKPGTPDPARVLA